jgi:hypothetical protein
MEIIHTPGRMCLCSVYVCTYVYMYVCYYVCRYLRMCICMYCVCMYVCIYLLCMCVSTCAHMCVCMYFLMGICMYYICMYACTYVYLFVSIYLCVCICVCMYLCTYYICLFVSYVCMYLHNMKLNGIYRITHNEEWTDCECKLIAVFTANSCHLQIFMRHFQLFEWETTHRQSWLNR